MRIFSTVLTVALFLSLTLPPASAAGIKGRIQDRLGDAVDEHNQQVDDALGNGQNKPPEPIPAGALKTGFLTRKSRDGKDVRLYFAYPAALNKSKPAPGIILLHESWGLNDDLQQRAQEFAAKGFYAVAPDLFSGKTTDDPAQAAKLQAAATTSSAMSPMKTALDLLTEESKNGVIDTDHIAAFGAGMGAQMALALAIEDPRIKATILFYGPLVTDVTRLRALQGPVLLVTGNSDTAPAPADVDKFKSAMKIAGRTDLTLYQVDGVGHDFASKSAAKTGAYNPDKATEAWSRTWAWIDKKLPRK